MSKDKTKPEVKDGNAFLGAMELHHPAFGKLEVYRTASSHAINMTGSEIKHQDWLSFKLSSAKVERMYHQDRIVGTKPIVEFSMPVSGLVSLISQIGISHGIPITLERIPVYDSIESVPMIDDLQDNIEQIKNEIDQKTVKIQRDILNLVNDLKDAIENKKGIKNIREVLSSLESRASHISSNMQFGVTQAHKAIDAKKERVANEIAARMETIIRDAGITAINEELESDFSKKIKHQLSLGQVDQRRPYEVVQYDKLGLDGIPDEYHCFVFSNSKEIVYFAKETPERINNANGSYWYFHSEYISKNISGAEDFKSDTVYSTIAGVKIQQI